MTNASNTASNQPIRTLRDGNLKAVIWQNQGENGSYFTVQLRRTYKVEDGYRDTDSLSNADLLRIAHLATSAYEEISELRKQ